MIYVYAYLAAAPVLFFALWVMYLAVYHLKKVDKITPLPWHVRSAGKLLLMIAVALNIFLNIAYMTLICVALPSPRRLMISARLKYYNTHRVNAWKKRIARAFEPWLDPFDPSGNHI